MFRTLFLGLFTVITFLVGAVSAVGVALFSRNKPSVYFQAGKIWARLLLWGAGVKLTVHSQEHWPQEPGALFAANHQGDFDIPILFLALPVPFLFIVKKELFRIPVLGWYLRQAGYVSIDRQDRDLANATLEEVVTLLKSGKSILIFPEGTRSPTGEVSHFKRGAFALAQAAQKPIIPVSICGSFEVKRKGSLAVKPGQVAVYFEQPVYLSPEDHAKERQKEIAEQIREVIRERVETYRNSSSMAS